MANSGIVYGDLPHETDSGSELYGNFIGFIRPHSKWKGEGFGFDFVPNSIFMNEKEFKIGKQYKKKGSQELELAVNEYSGDFRDDDDKMLNSLLSKEYKSDIKFLKETGKIKIYSSWLSLYPKKGTVIVNNVTFQERSILSNSIKDVTVKILPITTASSVPKNYTLNTSAKLDISIFGNGVPDYFAFAENKHFKITPSKMEIADRKKKDEKEKELKSKPKDGPISKRLLQWKVAVEITCLTEFDIDQELILNAYFVQKSGKIETVMVAKLMVWANKARGKTRKIVMVQVTTPAMSEKDGLTGVAPSDLSACNVFLRQALVEVEVDEIIKLNLEKEPEFLSGGIYRQGNTIEAAPRNPEQSILGALWDKAVGNEPPPQPISLAPFLVDKIGNKYKDHLKLFFFAESDKTASTLAFNSAIDPSVTVYYKAQEKKQFDQNIIAHELLHGFKLGHSFSNSEAGEEAEKIYGYPLISKYTYRFNESNNVMDYGNRNDKYGTWHWQWEIINKK